MVATMRTPQTDLIPLIERLKILALDVTSAESITKAVDAAMPLAVACGFIQKPGRLSVKAKSLQ